MDGREEESYGTVYYEMCCVEGSSDNRVFELKACPQKL